MEYTYMLYQIKDVGETMYAFRPWDDAEDLVKLDDYKLVFRGEIEANHPMNLLNALFGIFNMEKPEGYKGRSMSTSDIVCLVDDDGVCQWYYCDDIGWRDITEVMWKMDRI